MRVWLTQTISLVGSTLSGIGVAVHVYLDTGDTRWLGVLAAVQALPFLFMAPALGRLDRFSRRSMLLVGDSVAAIGPVFALILSAFGRLSVWHLVVAGLLSGVGNAIQAPAASAVVPALVPPESLARANGLFQLGPAAGIVLGPALATPLVAWFGVEAVLIVDIITFALAAITTTFTRFADVPADAEVTDDGSWRAALRWLITEGRSLMTLLMVMGAVNFLLSFFNVGLLAVATDVGGAAPAGIAVGAGGVAMIIGSLLAERTGVDERPVPVFAAGLMITAVGCLLTGLRPWFPLVVVGVIIAVAPGAVVNAGLATLFHTRVPAQMHGRIFAVRSTVARSLDPIGSLVAGLVVAGWAAPAMQRGHHGAELFGGVIGSGEERGAALMLVVTAFALGALACWMATHRGLARLNRDETMRSNGVAARVAASVIDTALENEPDWSATEPRRVDAPQLRMHVSPNGEPAAALASST